MNRKLLFVTGALAAIIILGAFTRIDSAQYPQQDDEYKAENLKILPKNISEDDLGAVMKSFSKALGVRCNYCHVPKEGSMSELDYVSDANPMKNVTRDMMKMTQKINKKNIKKFYKKHAPDGAIQQIGCVTCHHGDKKPVTFEGIM